MVLNKKSLDGKVGYTICVFLLLVFIMGFRGENVGCDLPFYELRFENSPNMWARRSFDSEWGYTLLNYLFKCKLNVGFQFFVFFVSIVCISAVLTIIHRYSDDFTLSVIEYVTVGNFALNMSGLRQTVAISIALFSIIAIEKKKKILFILLIATAFLMHNSVVIFIPAYFLWNKKITRKQGVIILIISCLSIVYRRALNPLIVYLSPEKYLDMNLDTDYSINVLVLLVPIVICIYCLVYMNTDEKGKFSSRDSMFFVFSCISILLMILSLNNNQLGRLSYYYNIGYGIIVASAMKAHNYKDADSYKWVRFLMVTLFVAYFFISERGGTMHIDDYHFFWSNSGNF